MKRHVNNTYTFSSLRRLAQLHIQQAVFNTTQLQEITQVLQEQIYTVRTRIACQQSAEGILQRLSDRSTSGLNYLCQGRDRIQSDIDVLRDMISRYGGVHLYLNKAISDQLRKNRDKIARHMEHTTRWISEAQGNIKRLGDTIGLINRTIHEDQVRMETMVRETGAAVTAWRDQQMTLGNRLDGLLDGALLKY
ncbi:MAG: hypothetical protein L6R42_000489 [Xanthoria sp. 1 TBL-2021]|nr:MAG: hypothetical protein L6R42_000489 [Xanthoria sp. 1 TBL-2021]